MDLGGSWLWTFDGKTFRYRRNSSEKFNETENLRINFIEYKGVLYSSCIFFMNDSTIYEGWDFYGPDSRPSEGYWGFGEDD